jgi:hypothetical protein
MSLKLRYTWNQLDGQDGPLTGEAPLIDVSGMALLVAVTIF